MVLGQAANSKVIEIMLRDSTTGQGKTGLVHDSAGMTAYYVREGGATAVEIVLAHGAAGDAYSSGKLAELDGTNMPGVYQLHVPNAALATAANACTILVKATGVINSKTRILIIATDLRATAIGTSTLTQTQVTGGAYDITNEAVILHSIGDHGAGLSAIPAVATVTTVTNQLTGATIADAVWDEASTGHTDAGKAGALLWTDIPAAPAAALVSANLDHLVGTATGIPSLPAGTFLDIAIRDGTATYDRTTDSLQAIRDKLPANLEDLSVTDTTGLVKPDMATTLGRWGL
jgi:hypothetical protein